MLAALVLWLAAPGIASARTASAGLLGSRAQVVRWAVQAAALGDLPSEQIRAMEQQVRQVLAEAQRQQDQLLQLRQRLAAAESAGQWMPWLVLGLVAVGALSMWLALRLRRLQRVLNERPSQPSRLEPPYPTGGPATEAGAARMQPAGQGLLSSANAQSPALQGAMTAAQPRLLAAAAADGELARTQTGTDGPMAPRSFSLGTGVPPRPVSVEELLDLDQQVEFFRVLGQEQAAIDLLLSHVRSTGGTNALPYFKLLEIYRHRGDEEAYERTRERFNQRFNAQAPDWSGDLMAGRSLEDYPAVITRLQQVWLHPGQAVADIESLLLRRADLEPFDMPAYRDVLMLHALARDLPGFEADGTATVPFASGSGGPTTEPMSFDAPPSMQGDAVDLLLPLDEGPLDITTQRPALSERTSAQAMLAEWVFTRATSPRTAADADALWAQDGERSSASRPVPLDLDIDLDLSEFAPAPREFTRPAPFAEVELRRDSRLSGFGYDDLDGGLPPLPSRH